MSDEVLRKQRDKAVLISKDLLKLIDKLREERGISQEVHREAWKLAFSIENLEAKIMVGEAPPD